MQVNCYLITPDIHITACAYDTALEVYRQGTQHVWFDIIDAGKDDIQQQLDAFEIHGLLRNFILNSSDHPGFYPLHPVVLLVMPVLMKVQHTNSIAYLSVLLGTKFLVTIRQSSMARFRSDLAFDDSAEVLPDGTPAGIIAAICLGLSLEALRKASQLAHVISDMEARLDVTPQSVKMEALSDCRTEVMVLETIITGQIPILKIVATSDKKVPVQETAKNYLQWAIANLEAAEKKLDWLEHRIELMRSAIDMFAQDTMNKRLGRLTILSMIFMPVTFLAGIWGMNFDHMPLLSNTYGYAIAVALMLAIAAFMYLFFKRKGWFDS